MVDDGQKNEKEKDLDFRVQVSGMRADHSSSESAQTKRIWTHKRPVLSVLPGNEEILRKKIVRFFRASITVETPG